MASTSRTTHWSDFTPPESPRTLCLGIETSCDETAAAVVADGRVVLSSVVASQTALHAPFGGVFPEMASRQHIRDIAPVVARALRDAGATWTDLESIAVTRGPGLAGSLLVGVNFGKGLALATGLPLCGVNHLAGHLASNWLHEDGVLRTSADPALDPAFPHLTLIASGGHTDLVVVNDHGRYELLGSTCDDAAGEALDKAARLLGLPYPGGPALEIAARDGNPDAFRLPVARTDRPTDFSFSGLKSALRRTVDELGSTSLPVSDLAASFQAAVVKALVHGVERAADSIRPAEVHLAGGVSANQELRRLLRAAISVPVRVPPPELCTDNAAMIAAAAGLARPPGRIMDLGDGLALDVEAGLGLG